jgi:hypothetical protein
VLAQHCEKRTDRKNSVRKWKQPTRGRVVNISSWTQEKKKPLQRSFFSFVCPGVHVTKPIEEKGGKGEEEAL